MKRVSTLATKLVNKKSLTDFESWLDKTYRFLSYRPRSEKEITDYLYRKGVSKGVIAQVTTRLRKQALIDDKEFASWWLRQRADFRPRGLRALRFELRQKGVSEAVLRAALAGVDEFKLARKALKRPVRSYEQAARFLSQRGFSWPVIKQILDEVYKKE